MTPRIKVLVAVASALGVIALIDFAWRSSSAEMASQSPMGASFSAYNAITKDEPSHAAAKLAPVDAKSPGFLQPLFSPARVANHPDQIESVIFDEPAQSPTDPFEASRLVGIAHDGHSAIALLDCGGETMRLKKRDVVGE